MNLNKIHNQLMLDQLVIDQVVLPCNRHLNTQL